MSNHVHLIAEAADHNLSDIPRDFKSYTAKLLIKAIVENPESRREWMLSLFKKAGEKNRNNTNIQIWQQDNQYKEVHSKEFAFQKFDYIHFNPVEAGIVEKGEDYIYSSEKIIIQERM